MDRVIKTSLDPGFTFVSGTNGIRQQRLRFDKVKEVLRVHVERRSTISLEEGVFGMLWLYLAWYV